MFPDVKRTARLADIRFGIAKKCQGWGQESDFQLNDRSSFDKLARIRFISPAILKQGVPA